MSKFRLPVPLTHNATQYSLSHDASVQLSRHTPSPPKLSHNPSGRHVSGVSVVLVRQHILSAVPAVLQGTYSWTPLPSRLDAFMAVALGKKHWPCTETNCKMQNAGMNNRRILTYKVKSNGQLLCKETDGEKGRSSADRARKSGTESSTQWASREDCTGTYASSASLPSLIAPPHLVLITYFVTFMHALLLPKCYLYTHLRRYLSVAWKPQGHGPET